MVQAIAKHSSEYRFVICCLLLFAHMPLPFPSENFFEIWPTSASSSSRLLQEKKELQIYSEKKAAFPL